VLQEQEFERLGSTRSIQTDVRIIAATHRDLWKMVSAGIFREDLYRLTVFPIAIPPVRDRAEDIPRLAEHFTRYYAHRFHKTIEGIHPDVIETLTRYSWPGNIRELQNFIERAVILSNGSMLKPSCAEMMRLRHPISTEPVTLIDVERAHIARILGQVNGE
jgi:formate hydrogenlyase transcriptional activator